MARQNERQRHGEFLLLIQLLAELSGKTIIKDAWHCPITKGAAINQQQRHGRFLLHCDYLKDWVWIIIGKMYGNATITNRAAVNQQQRHSKMSGNSTANLYCQCDYMLNWGRMSAKNIMNWQCHYSQWGSNQSVAKARQNEWQQHSKFLLQMRLLRELSEETEHIQCNVSHRFDGIDKSLPSGLWVECLAWQ